MAYAQRTGDTSCKIQFTISDNRISGTIKEADLKLAKEVVKIYENKIKINYANEISIIKSKNNYSTALDTIKKAFSNMCATYTSDIVSVYEGSEIKLDANSTLAEVVACWRNTTESEYRTIVGHNSHLRHEAFKPLLRMPVKNIDVYEIEVFKKKLSTHGKGMSGTTAYNYFTTLRMLLNRAIDWKVIQVLPYTKGQSKRLIPKVDTREASFIKDEQINIFLEKMMLIDDKIIKSKYKVAFEVAMFSGCRAGEICAITWKDIDWTGKSISISKSASEQKGKGIVIKRPKSKHSIRQVFITDRALESLKVFKEKEIIRRKELGLDYSDDSHVFIGERTKGVMSPITLSKNFAHIRELIPEIGEVTLHGLRHTNAYLKLKSGCVMKTVSEDLGHRDVVITSRIYAHTDERDRKAATELLNEKFSLKAKKFVDSVDVTENRQESHQ